MHELFSIGASLLLRKIDTYFLKNSKLVVTMSDKEKHTITQTLVKILKETVACKNNAFKKETINLIKILEKQQPKIKPM